MIENIAEELSENNTANLDENNSNEIRKPQLPSPEMGTVYQANLDELSNSNQQKIENLKGNLLTDNGNEVTPNFFRLTWDDVPYEIDEETGEKSYEVNSGKQDEYGNKNPEHPLLNQHPLPENSTIIVNTPDGKTTIYKTDDLGRVKSMETPKVDIVDEADRQRDGNATSQTKAIKDGKTDDQGGHLLGDRFGGSSEQINLLPMAPETNQGAFRKVEETIAKAIKEGKPVTDYKVEVIYDGDSDRPSGFKVTYNIDGKPYTAIIAN